MPPIASGAGVGFLIAETDGADDATTAALLMALGVFGFTVTAGLFFYEVRQIDVCKQLRNRAEFLESEMDMGAAQYSARRPRLSLREIYRPIKVGGERDERFEWAERRGERHTPEGPAGMPGWRRRMIGAEAAGYVVYHAVMASWVFVFVVGLCDLVCT